MRRIISIILIALLLVQTTTVIQLSRSLEGFVYTLLAEEKAEDGAKVQKEWKEYLSPGSPSVSSEDIKVASVFVCHALHASPYLEFMAPPPDSLN